MKVVIYSDGGADPNPGVGGWAAILRFGDQEQVLTGNDPDTTNSRMELQAAIAALQALPRPSVVEFYTDSQYVRRGITEWITNWAKNGWRTSAKKPVANADLWRQLWAATQTHTITWHWVKGHAGDPLNERVDQLAREAREAITPTRQLGDNIPRLFVRASCKGNPGPGGWGAILEEGENTRQISGGAADTTNNRMELMGVIEGIRLLPPGRVVQIFTTSNYLYLGATRWLVGWRQSNWRKKGDRPVANADLWLEIDRLQQQYQIIWVNAKGQQKEERGLIEANLLATQARQTA